MLLGGTVRFEAIKPYEKMACERDFIMRWLKVVLTESSTHNVVFQKNKRDIEICLRRCDGSRW